MDDDRDGRCCLCGEAYTNIGNSPWPFMHEHDDPCCEAVEVIIEHNPRCCDACVETYIIPARLRLLAIYCEQKRPTK